MLCSCNSVYLIWLFIQLRISLGNLLLHSKGMLRDALVGLLASGLFDTCCGLMFVGYRLSYICFRQVHKGLLVSGTIERIKLPLELFIMTIWII